MNYTKHTGWYYNHLNDRAPAWTGVEHLHRFLTTNKGKDPYGDALPIEKTKPGDIIQLSFGGHIFAHSLFVINVDFEIWDCPKLG